MGPPAGRTEQVSGGAGAAGQGGSEGPCKQAAAGLWWVRLMKEKLPTESRVPVACGASVSRYQWLEGDMLLFLVLLLTYLPLCKFKMFFFMGSI